MTLDLEPITQPSSKLDLEPVSGKAQNLDLEPIKPAQSKSPTGTEASDKALQDMGVDTQPPEASYKSTPFGEGLGSGIIQGAKSMIPRSIGQAAVQAASMATPLVDAYRGIVRPFQQGSPSTLRAKPFTEFTPEDWGKFTAEMGIDVAQAAMLSAGLEGAIKPGGADAIRIASTEGVSQREVRPQVGEETPLRQQGETPSPQTPAQTPQETNVVGGDTNEQTIKTNQESPSPLQGEPRETTVPQESGTTPLTPSAEPALTVPERADAGAVPSEPVVSEVANKYTQERSQNGDLGVVEPGRGTSAAELATRGQKIVEKEGEGVVDQAVSRVMSGVFDPVNDAAVVRFQEARLRVKKDIAYRELQKNPQNAQLQINYDNAFKDLTDFHNGPLAQVKANWAEGGRGLQGQFPVDVSTADGIREAWLQATGEDAPAEVKPTIQKVADRVKRSIDGENGAKSKLYDQIEQDFAKSKQKSHEAIRDRFMKELKERPCR